ncbi:toll/interleukin-1 receptor domain-containing protein (plasmid) [Lichenicola cladoniae]|uniref:Toll/interleukin-1 receptor domain-containing protein n=1 Tax=Lichenicola cladoniae TaxID=1484109 RepID=A0A6M8HYF8_9PROT|nr:toll/interleukin-1 receptor domain-containing protein [Lichenicola cladoniae]QKE93604.1 toll/interleukin-1 receptor domain-containing protein [Lichenicola cladoniae]
MPLAVLISHAHDERLLAEAWKALLSTVSQGAIAPWYSSDRQPDGGMQIGEEWREHLRREIQKTDYILAVLSPQSRDRPWILYECGLAAGIAQEKKNINGQHNLTGVVIPILYSMTAGDLANPLASFNVYMGDSKDAVIEVCERLLQQAGLTPQRNLWATPIDRYMDAVAAHRPRRAHTAENMILWRTRIEALVQSGRSGEVYATRARMYATFGQPFRPMNVQLHDVLSKIMLDEKHFQAAIEETNFGLELAPDDIDLLHRKALGLLHCHNRDKALQTITQLVALDAALASNPEIAGLEGRVLREIWENSRDPLDLSAARVAYRRATDANASDYYCAVNAASLALAAADTFDAKNLFDRALQGVRKAQEKQPISYWTDFSAGEIALGQGTLQLACEEYAKGLTRVPAPPARDRESALKGVRRMAALGGFGPTDIKPIEHLLG